MYYFYFSLSFAVELNPFRTASVANAINACITEVRNATALSNDQQFTKSVFLETPAWLYVNDKKKDI